MMMKDMLLELRMLEGIKDYRIRVAQPLQWK